jgi:drug/metabolite transporter (DMT)-like permease
LLLAFTLVFLSWGTTFLAIKRGVQDEHLPPALFGGVRVCLAGVLLLTYLALRGERLRLPQRDLAGITLGGLLLFVGGNGLLTLGETTLPSGLAAVLGATTPLWMASLEMLWPGGERLSGRGWLGLAIGLGGVVLLLAPKVERPGEFLTDLGPLFVLGSAVAWALGSLVRRYWRVGASHLTGAGYQMLLGGGCLALLGVLVGEVHDLPGEVTSGAVGAFVYLLIFGSLVGFVAFHWLLGHVSTARAGTHAYVCPVVAVFVGCLLDGEELTGWIVGGVVVILAGVALVRSSHSRPPNAKTHAANPEGASARGNACAEIDGRWNGCFGKIQPEISRKA